MISLRNCLLTLLVFGSVLLASAAELPDPKLTEYWTPQPPVVSSPEGGVPSDAIVLFDGTNLDEWLITRENDEGEKVMQPANWVLEDGAMIVPPRVKNSPSSDVTSVQAFGDIQLHLEWRAPVVTDPSKVSQQRGNSGIFFMNRYEVQVLDCYENLSYVNGMTASIYKQQVPLANVCRPPGEWQTYDIFFVAPKFEPDGTLLEKAHITVVHNGVVVLLNAPIYGPTEYRGQPSYKFHTPRQPLRLQDHNNPVAYRNIWVRELDLN
ncbi:MAG: 3-keto-disaccharide hydrolase [Verrucomicrobiia bacterium]